MSKKVNEDKIPVRVLVIGSNKDQASAINKALVGAGYTVKVARAQEKEDAVNALKKYVWDIVFTPVNNVTPEAVHLYSQLAMKKSSTPVLAIADDVNCRSARLALDKGARDVVYPLQPHRFLSVIQRELSDLEARRNHLIIQSQFRLQQKEREALASQEVTGLDQTFLPDNSLALSTLSKSNNHKYDMTTGLYSQQYFIDELENVLTDIGSARKKYAVLYFEFTGFDELRADLGINASNSMLSDIATIVRDNVGYMGPIARLSNHAYTVLVAFTKLDELMPVINKSRTLIGEYISIVMAELPVPGVINVGMCMVNKTGENACQLIAKSRCASEIARKINNSGVHIYNPEVDDIDGLIKSQPRKDWEKEISLALQEGRCKVVFQMLSTLDASEGDGYELLFRLKDKVSGADIMPDEFMVIAEQTGLINIIDKWVTGQAIKMIVADMKQERQSSYFIKLSNRTVNDNNFIPWLLGKLKKNDIPSSRLVFEIDATELVKHPIESHIFIRSLNRLNCRVTLEYFGTQHNHLSVVEQFDVAFLKLDRSLTHRVAAEPERLASIKSIVEMADDANIETIVEFIEDAKTLGVLCNVGVNYIQGNFVQQPGGILDAG